MDGRGSLLLTTGPRFEEDPSSAARLVELLKQSGMVGVGVAIMPYVREIPAEMVAAADREQLPLLRVPEGTPFREITSYVFNALSSRDMHRLRRSVALQKQLLEVLLAEQDPSGLVRRVGELLGASMLLFAASGRLVGSFMTADRTGRGRRSRATPGAPTGRSRRAGHARSVLDVQGRHVAFRRGARRRCRRAGPDGCVSRGQPDLRVRGRGVDVRPAPARGRGDDGAQRVAAAPPHARRPAGHAHARPRDGSGARRAAELPRHRADRAVAHDGLLGRRAGGGRRRPPLGRRRHGRRLAGHHRPAAGRGRRALPLAAEPRAGAGARSARGVRGRRLPSSTSSTDIAENAGTRLRTERIDVGVSVRPVRARHWSPAPPARPVSRCVTRTCRRRDRPGRRLRRPWAALQDPRQLCATTSCRSSTMRWSAGCSRRTGAAHSDLLRTLETYLACGGSVADAAAELYVHRNTAAQETGAHRGDPRGRPGDSRRPGGGVSGRPRQGRPGHAQRVRRAGGRAPRGVSR